MTDDDIAKEIIRLLSVCQWRYNVLDMVAQVYCLKCGGEKVGGTLGRRICWGCYGDD